MTFLCHFLSSVIILSIDFLPGAFLLLLFYVVLCFLFIFTIFVVIAMTAIKFPVYY